MRTLVTNDDGVRSLGLHWLARAARDHGLDPYVAAPSEERSGASASLSGLETDQGPVAKPFEAASLDGIEAWGVEGAPAFIVRGCAGGDLCEVPGLVLSGINRGPNTGSMILHSGTVGAAFTAASHGIPAIAFSSSGTDPQHEETHVAVVSRVLAWFCEREWPSDGAPVLNVNIPDVAPADFQGLTRARLATFGTVEAERGRVGEGYVSVSIQQADDDDSDHTDEALLRAGWATVTALQAPCESRTPGLRGLSFRAEAQ
ncbi:5'-nucleotidase [Intrasporangium chromatireducens Q5-1]|uniref:5'-nucleotidase n=1 Tax=Intrasporangium chromatireducens Q5-1 TaxID=584657 RepID=W9GK49_9MICO|nr:5'/3'-nucleotidase SurE [Intrasporangium chromatireducens]EWT06475.1 5'-nucleotidase [Intrasporangium chromatireducens Q5-1]